MMRLCSRSEHCRSDILSRVKALDVPDPEAVVEKLCKEGFIDDARYASAFARDKSSLSGWGSLKIKLALQAKGIDQATIAAALGDVDEESAGRRLDALLRAKMRSLRGDEDERERKMKVVRYAMGRGYDYETIIKAYDDIRTD